MRKIKQVVAMIGIFAMTATGCKGKEQVLSTEKLTEVVESTDVKSNTENLQSSDVNESENMTGEEWTKLWPGEPMDVNLEAKHGLIDSFNKDGHDMYKAMGYDGKLVTENAYCYFFSKYLAKNFDVFADMKFPVNLEEVSGDIWDNGMTSWIGGLGEMNGAFLDRSTLTIEVQSKGM